MNDMDTTQAATESLIERYPDDPALVVSLLLELEEE